MVKINPSSLLIADLQRVLSSTEENGSLIASAIKIAFSKHMHAALVPQKYMDKSAFKPYWIPPALMQKIKFETNQVMISDSSISHASLVMGLLVAVVESLKENAPATNSICQESEWLKAAGYRSRKEQDRLISEVERALTSKSDAIVMAEASVGVGKSLALASVAIKHALEDKDHQEFSVVLAAPTYQVAKQLMAAVQSLVSANEINITAQLYRSRAEFVSEQLIKAYLDEKSGALHDECIAKARDLLSDGEFLKSKYEEIGLDCQNLLLSRMTDPDDLAELAYLRDRQKLKHTDVIVCTHALLACHTAIVRRSGMRGIGYDQLTNMNFQEINELVATAYQDNNQAEALYEKGILPNISLLLLDEAHLISDTFASIRNRSISLQGLRQDIKQIESAKVISSAKSSIAMDAIEAFEQKVIASPNDRFSAKITMKFYQEINSALNLVTKKSMSRHYIKVLMALEDLKALSTYSDRLNERLVSPVRRQVSIQSLKSIPIDWMDLIWRMSEQAVLTSGTLAIQSRGHDYSQMAVKMVVPMNRLKEIAPIETEWLRKGVTLHIVKPSENESEVKKCYVGTAFLPPKYDKARTNKKEIVAWCQAQSSYIQQQLNSITGGIIIFCTNYDQVHLLHDSLKTFVSKSDVLLQSVQGLSISSQVASYENAYFANRRPIWVAISAAGTGINISDSDAAPVDDHMIDALFITRLPLAPNRNQYMQAIRDGVILVRQMMGRLVRRPGRTNMQIHILDARGNIKRGSERQFATQFNRYEISTIQG